MKSSKDQLKLRGYIEDKDLKLYHDFSKEELIERLNSKVAVNRTIAARSLIQYKDKDVLEILISRLEVEKKLYTKIALSETIGAYDGDACEELIKYLGGIGDNQHRKLPDQPFSKKNYPLPRDIIARTICKIGQPALKYLKDCLAYGEYKQVLEAIDAIGFISYYEKDNCCLYEIMLLLDTYKDDDLMVWKLLRSLQAFPEKIVLDKLKPYIYSSIKQHRWEAARSIEQIQNQLKI